MSNEIVKYHNDLNMVSMRSWKKNEMDFFFAIISKAKNKGESKLEFNTDELKILCDFKAETLARWNEVLESAQKKIVGMYYWEKTPSGSRAMTLFSYFDINYDNHTVRLKVSENFDYILNKLNANFTRYELEEFVGIKSTYAKTMYRLLKQWRMQGEHEWPVEQFRSILGIPESYSIGDIQKRVLKPILQELPQYFPNLKCKVIKKRTKGNPVIAYKFTFEKDKVEIKSFRRHGYRIEKEEVYEQENHDVYTAEEVDEALKFLD